MTVRNRRRGFVAVATLGAGLVAASQGLLPAQAFASDPGTPACTSSLLSGVSGLTGILGGLGSSGSNPLSGGVGCITGGSGSGTSTGSTPTPGSSGGLGGLSGGLGGSSTGGLGGLTGGLGGATGGSGGSGLSGDPLGSVAGALNDALGSVTLTVPFLATLDGVDGPNAIPHGTIDEARTKLFGAGWDNPNIVRARSVGNTTWLFDYGGTIVLHDGTIDSQLTNTGDKANSNGFLTLGDVIAAHPAVILQDHTHFDQEHNSAEIAATGVPVVTDVGGCLWLKTEAIKKGIAPSLVNCNLIRDENGNPFFTTDSWALGPYAGQGLLGLTPFGAIGHPTTPLPGGLTDKIVQVKHSPSFYGRPYPEEISGPNVDPLRSAQEIINAYKGANPLEIAGSIYNQYAAFDLEGSNVLHLVNYRGFTVAHHGSTGPTNNLEPGAAAISQALKGLGTAENPVDVEIGGVAEMTFLLNGYNFTDQKLYSEDIGAKMYFPTHHYDWYPIWLTNPAATYYPGMKAAWAQGNQETGGKMPNMCYLTEANYGTVFQWDIAQWQGTHVGTVTETGPGCYTG